MNSKNKVILVVFDDLFSGGAFTLTHSIFSGIKPKLPEDIYVLTGISTNQVLHKELFPYAKKIITYSIPDVGHPLRFLHILIRTIASIHTIQRQYFISAVVTNIVYSAVAAKFYCVVRKIPYIYLYHGALYLEKKSYLQGKISSVRKLKHDAVHLLHWLMQYYIVRFSVVGCFSMFSKSQIRQLFHQNKSRIIRVPFTLHETTLEEKIAARKSLGIDLNTSLIVAPSRIEPRKGQDALLKALSSMPKDIRVTCLLCGPIHPNAVYYFSDLFRTLLPSTVNVFFTAEKTPEDIWMLYKAADATIMPSVGLETLGMVTLESLSVGTPVIAFSVGGSEEILRPFPELLAKHTTPLDLARAIVRFIRLPEHQKQTLKTQIKNYMLRKHDPSHTLSDFRGLMSDARVYGLSHHRLAL